jgi:hypothetical protein
VSRTRRDPKFSAFIVTGALIGFVVGSAIAFVGPDADRYDFTTALGYLAVLGGLLGALGGALVAVLLSRN